MFIVRNRFHYSISLRSTAISQEFSRSRTESEYFDAPLEGEFEGGFIDFLNKLEQRQEMIKVYYFFSFAENVNSYRGKYRKDLIIQFVVFKESALRLLSPPRIIADNNRNEKSVQTAPICFPAEVFAPEVSSLRFCQEPLRNRNLRLELSSLIKY